MLKILPVSLRTQVSQTLSGVIYLPSKSKSLNYRRVNKLRVLKIFTVGSENDIYFNSCFINRSIIRQVKDLNPTSVNVR